MAAKKRSSEKTATKKETRGGTWKHVRPEEILTYRKDNGISRAKLASTLGVSATSVQNWEGGRVAALPTQRRLRLLIDGEEIPPAPGTGPEEDCVVTVTGQIVAAYLTHQEPLDGPELSELIRRVKRALID
jgi:DNA-binding transcriptional regulator YiaG